MSNIPRVVELLAQRGVQVVTLYAFSTENWRRPSDEVDSLMAILAEQIEPQTQELHKAGVRLVHLGDMSPLDPALQDAIRQAQDITRHNDGIIVNIAFNYGGREEILQAVRRMLADGVVPEDVDESLFSRVPVHQRLPGSGLDYPNRPASSGSAIFSSGRRPTASTTTRRCFGRTWARTIWIAR